MFMGAPGCAGGCICCGGAMFIGMPLLAAGPALDCGAASAPNGDDPPIAPAPPPIPRSCISQSMLSRHCCAATGRLGCEIVANHLHARATAPEANINDGAWICALNFLRHDADLRLVIALEVIAINIQAIVEQADGLDILL